MLFHKRRKDLKWHQLINKVFSVNLFHLKIGILKMYFFFHYENLSKMSLQRTFIFLSCCSPTGFLYRIKLFPLQARCCSTSNAHCHKSPASRPLTSISLLQAAASFHVFLPSRKAAGKWLPGRGRRYEKT